MSIISYSIINQMILMLEYPAFFRINNVPKVILLIYQTKTGTEVPVKYSISNDF